MMFMSFNSSTTGVTTGVALPFPTIIFDPHILEDARVDRLWFLCVVFRRPLFVFCSLLGIVLSGLRIAWSDIS
jgi:hypothetical protein